MDLLDEDMGSWLLNFYYAFLGFYELTMNLQLTFFQLAAKQQM
jgi:hypothetical protein